MPTILSSDTTGLINTANLSIYLGYNFYENKIRILLVLTTLWFFQATFSFLLSHAKIISMNNDSVSYEYSLHNTFGEILDFHMGSSQLERRLQCYGEGSFWKL